MHVRLDAARCAAGRQRISSACAARGVQGWQSRRRVGAPRPGGGTGDAILACQVVINSGAAGAPLLADPLQNAAAAYTNLGIGPAFYTANT